MIRLTVNGRKRVFRDPPFKRLIDVLRQDFGLTGTKEGCSEGECGACTVLVDKTPVNSCLIPVAQVEGSHVETIESLGHPQALSLLQEAFLKHGGAQCGMCTPGMLMTATAYLLKNKRAAGEDVRKALTGNLCRCTGYQHIVNSVIKASKLRRKRGKMALT